MIAFLQFDECIHLANQTAEKPVACDAQAAVGDTGGAAR